MGELFNKIKSGLKSAVDFEDEERYAGDGGEEYYEDEDNDYYDDGEQYTYDDEEEQSEPSSYEKKSSRFNEYDSVPTYNPAGPYEASKKSYSRPSKTSGFKSSSSRKASSPIDAPRSHSTSNVYDMNSGRAVENVKINLFVLEDLDDARNVADSMKQRSIVCIVDFKKLSVEDERRVLDFLDGVKYMLNSKVTKIADRMFLIVPDTALLSGPFEDNYDIDFSF